jgi:hypothetical protein
MGTFTVPRSPRFTINPDQGVHSSSNLLLGVSPYAIDIRDFGPVTEGVDITAPLTRAFAEKDAAGGAEIRIPGSYVLSGLVNTGTKPFSLHGAGWNYRGGSVLTNTFGSVLLCQGAGGLVSNNSNMNGASIKDLAFLGAGSGIGILVSDPGPAATSRYNLENLFLSNWGTGLRLENCEDCILDHIITSANGIGIDIGANASADYCTDIRIYDGSGTTNETAAIRLLGGAQFRIDGGVYQGNSAAGILVAPDSGAQPVEGVQIEGLYLEGNPSGQVVFDTTNSSIKNVVIDNSHLSPQAFGFVSGANNFFGLYVGKGCDFIGNSVQTIPSWVTGGWSECQTMGSPFKSVSPGWGMITDPSMPVADTFLTTSANGLATIAQFSIVDQVASEWEFDVIAQGTDGSSFASWRELRATYQRNGSTVQGTDIGTPSADVSGGTHGSDFAISLTRSGTSILAKVNQGANVAGANWRITTRGRVVGY